MTIRTHLTINNNLCGRVLELAPGRCNVELVLTPVMQADASGLVHGGFVFGAADYAAMLAVNEANVVLAAAQVRFLKPCRVGETIRVLARVSEADARRPVVTASAFDAEGAEVFTATFNCAVPQRHVLDRQLA